MYLDGFETERLIVRPIRMEDCDAWEDFFRNNYFIDYLNLSPGFDAKAETKKWIEKQLWRYDNDLYGLMTLINKSTEKIIGQCGWLIQEVDSKKETEIGYHILPQYWGKGYALEAASAFKQKAIEHRIADSIISIIHVHNIRSQRVAEKNGMKREKESRYRDMPVYIYRIKLT